MKRRSRMRTCRAANAYPGRRASSSSWKVRTTERVSDSLNPLLMRYTILMECLADGACRQSREESTLTPVFAKNTSVALAAGAPGLLIQCTSEPATVLSQVSLERLEQSG